MADVPAARNTLRILKYLAEQAGPTRAATLARDLGIPRSSAYQLIGVLQAEGFVIHFPEERAFGLAPLVQQLGTSTDRASRLRRLGLPLVSKLLTRVKLPVVAHLGLLHGSEFVYLAQESAPRAPTLVSGIGVHLPAHLTATGRSMLAYLPHEQVRALYPDRDSLITRSGHGPRTLRELDDVLDETRERGWAMERDEVTAGHCSLAVGVLDHNNYPAAAIGLTFRSIAVDAHLLPQLGAAIQISASALSLRLRGKI